VSKKGSPEEAGSEQRNGRDHTTEVTRARGTSGTLGAGSPANVRLLTIKVSLRVVLADNDLAPTKTRGNGERWARLHATSHRPRGRPHHLGVVSTLGTGLTGLGGVGVVVHFIVPFTHGVGNRAIGPAPGDILTIVSVSAVITRAGVSPGLSGDGGGWVPNLKTNKQTKNNNMKCGI